MHGVEAHVRVRMRDPGTGDPSNHKRSEPRPGHPASLAPPPKRTVPAPDYLATKAFQTIQVSGDCMIVKVSLYHGPQPPPHLGYWLVPASPKLLLQLSQFGGESLADRLAFDDEPASLPGLPTDVREAQKVKCLRLALATLPPFCGGMAPNSIRRVLSGCNSNPNFCRRSFHSWRNRSASARCSNPMTKSSA